MIQKRPSRSRDGDYSGFSVSNQYQDLPFAQAFRSLLERETGERSFKWIGQPAESIVGGYFTAHRFCSGAVRLSDPMDIEHPVHDFAHMNQAYGTLVLRDLLQAASAEMEA